MTVRINTAMTHDLITLTTTMLANHITVRFPWLDAIETSLASTIRDRRPLGNRLTVLLHLLGIRLGLGHAGHRQFLYQLDGDPVGRWTIHLFFAEQNAIPLVASLTNGVVGLGEPASFDPREFIEQRLERLNNLDRLTSRHPWWDHERRRAA